MGIVLGQALYETAHLAHTLASSQLTHLSLVLLGPKGYEPLLSAHSLANLDSAFNRSFGKLNQIISLNSQARLMPICNFTFIIFIVSLQDAIYSCLGSFSFILTDMANQIKMKLVRTRPLSILLFDL